MREITFKTSEKFAETFSDKFLESGAYSAAVEDADNGTEDETPIYAEPGIEPESRAWRNSLIKVLAGDDFNDGVVSEILNNVFGKGAIAKISDAQVPDKDWVRITQEQFPPVEISRRLWIVPSWHEPPSDPKAVCLRLDPGVAFGTGAHPTTHMCLKWLDENLVPGASLLDWGTGTGILAIAAKKLGAGNVCANDIDPQALEAAKANANHNEAAVEFYTVPETPERPFGTVIANILANPLKSLAPEIIRRTAKGGSIVLSGILSHQAHGVIDAYLAAGAESMKVQCESEGWVLITGARRGE